MWLHDIRALDEFEHISALSKHARARLRDACALGEFWHISFKQARATTRCLCAHEFGRICFKQAPGYAKPVRSMNSCVSALSKHARLHDDCALDVFELSALSRQRGFTTPVHLTYSGASALNRHMILLFYYLSLFYNLTSEQSEKK